MLQISLMFILDGHRSEKTNPKREMKKKPTK